MSKCMFYCVCEVLVLVMSSSCKILKNQKIKPMFQGK